jgi:hypothetical protein
MGNAAVPQQRSVLFHHRWAQLDIPAILRTNRLLLGNAPPDDGSVFTGYPANDPATVYYQPGTSGWGSTFGGAHTVPLSPFTYTPSGGAVTITRYDPAFGSAVVIPATINGDPVTGIAASAFAGTGITSVSIPGSVTSIAAGAFADCTSLTGISVDPTNPAYSSLGGVLFDQAKATLIQFPGGVGGSYTIPGSVTSIGPDAFYGSAGLTSVTVPASVTTIGDYAFSDCASLASANFQGDAPNAPADDGTAFYGDAAKVYYQPGATGWLSMFGGIQTVLVIPFTYSISGGAATITGYTGGGGDVVIPSMISGSPVISIANSAFYNQSTITSLTLPDTLTSIGIEAVELGFSATLLAEVTGPTSVVLNWTESTVGLITNNHSSQPNYGVLVNPTVGFPRPVSTPKSDKHAVRWVDGQFKTKDDMVDDTGALIVAQFYELSTGVTNLYFGPPVTGSASNITDTAATLTGSDIPSEPGTVYWFVYGTDTNYGSFSGTNSMVSSTNPTPACAGINGLTNSTLYHFQLMASDSDLPGLQYGGDQTFTTLGVPPAVTTLAANPVGTTSATLNGTVNGEGSPTAGYFQYGPAANDYTNDTSGSQFYGPGNYTPYSASTALSGLVPGTIYHYRIVAFGASESFGADTNFTTEAIVIQPPPVVTTSGATAVTTNGATLNGYVDPSGDSTTVAYIEWGAVSGSYPNQTATNNITYAQPVSASLTGLNSSTPYYYRVVAANSGGTTQGSETNFTTAWLPAPPVLVSPGTATDTGSPVYYVTPTFTWDILANAASYGLVVMTYPGNSVVYQTTGLTGNSFGAPWYIVTPSLGQKRLQRDRVEQEDFGGELGGL